eukprot:1724183-Prymnesium_polylepis.1
MVRVFGMFCLLLRLSASGLRKVDRDHAARNGLRKPHGARGQRRVLQRQRGQPVGAHEEPGRLRDHGGGRPARPAGRGGAQIHGQHHAAGRPYAAQRLRADDRADGAARALCQLREGPGVLLGGRRRQAAHHGDASDRKRGPRQHGHVVQPERRVRELRGAHVKILRLGLQLLRAQQRRAAGTGDRAAQQHEGSNERQGSQNTPRCRRLR